jgi:hopene-associated glycosyltransferase HpnB
MTMQGFAVIAGAACVIVWLYLLLAHGRFWMVQRLGAEVAPLPEIGRIAAIIPARNEAEFIGKAVTSLLRQSCAGSIRIFVVDDNSTDQTAAAARQAALSNSRADALTIITGRPLPQGWSGKLWAVKQGIEQALRDNPQFLLLTDADIYHSPENVATLAAIAERGDYDLASLMVKLHCASVAEKLLIPAFVFFFFLLYPPAWIRNPRRKTAGAAGGCILIRPAALARAGGIEAVRKEIIDDCALAGAVKRSAGKVWLGVTPDTVSLRSYQSFDAIERMIARTAFNQLRHSAWLLIGALAGLILTYLLPLALLFSRSRAVVALGAAAYLLMVAVYSPTVGFYRLNRLWALTLPFSAAFYMWATLHSAVKYWAGRGGEWKGRSQDVMSRG